MRRKVGTSKVALPLVAAGLLGVAGEAYGADTHLYYNAMYIPSYSVVDLETALTGVGATVTTTTSSSWPTSWTGYELVIILLPASSFSTAQASALESFVNAGGRLVLSGDYGTSSAWGNSNATEVGRGGSRRTTGLYQRL